MYKNEINAGYLEKKKEVYFYTYYITMTFCRTVFHQCVNFTLFGENHTNGLGVYMSLAKTLRVMHACVTLKALDTEMRELYLLI